MAEPAGGAAPDGRAVVVGAGPNGLAAAVLLARAGLRVELHEATGRVGGGTRTEPLTLPGFLHDVCSAVHPMGAASPFFRELRLERHGLEWIHPPVCMAHPFDDGTAAVLLRSPKETAESLGAADGRSYRRHLQPFVDRWEGLLDEALGPVVHLPLRPLLMARFGWWGLRSGLGLVDAWFDGPRARAFLLGISAHALLPMERSPSGAFGMMLAVAAHGAGWPIPRGGSQRIADALAAVLREHGGRVFVDSPVRSLEPLGRPAATVLDLTPRQVLALEGTELPGYYRRGLERYRYGPGVFKVDWALSEPIPWAAPECHRAGTVHLGASAEEIAASSRAAWEGRPNTTPFVLLAQPSRFDPTRAPRGRHVAWAYCHVPHGSTRDMTAAIERQVERFAPGFRDTVLARSTMDTRELEAHNENLVGGDVNAGVQDVRQLLFRPTRRIDPYATPVEGLFLCSAATPPGGGVHGMCGYHAAESALRRMR